MFFKKNKEIIDIYKLVLDLLKDNRIRIKVAVFFGIKPEYLTKILSLDFLDSESMTGLIKNVILFILTDTDSTSRELENLYLEYDETGDSTLLRKIDELEKVAKITKRANFYKKFSTFLRRLLNINEERDIDLDVSNHRNSNTNLVIN
jgi:hypothetical protein